MSTYCGLTLVKHSVLIVSSWGLLRDCDIYYFSEPSFEALIFTWVGLTGAGAWDTGQWVALWFSCVCREN